jgi:hypothetical protein
MERHYNKNEARFVSRDLKDKRKVYYWPTFAIHLQKVTFVIDVEVLSSLHIVEGCSRNSRSVGKEDLLNLTILNSYILPPCGGEKFTHR